MAIFDCIIQLYTLYNCVIGCTNNISQMARTHCCLNVGPLSSTLSQRWNSVGQVLASICITFVQRRPNVFDDGPTLYKCYTNVSCLLNTPYIYTQPVTTPILLCNTNNGDHGFLESTVVCPDKTRSEYMKVISGLLWAYSKK